VRDERATDDVRENERADSRGSATSQKHMALVQSVKETRSAPRDFSGLAPRALSASRFYDSRIDDREANRCRFCRIAEQRFGRF